ncbi:TetR/AcrR family transcriptional regulator [Microlunatus elymi]|uniref:TetR/AcrR family transcriptional regulator n=1 Tax=Microlunatus elymi TaxID=2596828 RepID=UPI00143E0661|nr:TetR/AcrR family transcriptional regulator [Microlunatus elymi]
MTPEPLPRQPWLRSGRSPRRQLSLESIIEAALELLSTDGLDAVTMRKVAQRLDTGAASLYAYVRDKAELHELMLDEVMRELEVPEPDPECWQQQLKQVGLQVTRLMASRPGIARIALETLIPTTPHTLDKMDQMLALLLAGGLSADDAVVGADILSLYVAAGAYEQARQTSERAAHEAAERIDKIRDYLQLVPAGRLPHLIALAPAMARQGPHGYELGLDLIIDGLAARAARTAAVD